MGIAERRQREKERRRNEIIDAAEQVFFSRGKAAATMDDVAEAAELSKGTLYLYFKSKEELYLAINCRGLGILEKMFRDAVNSKKTGIEKTKAIGEAYYQFYREYPDYFNALIYFESHEMENMEENALAAECATHGHNTLNILIEAIQTGIDDGTIRPDVDPVKTATILWGNSSGLIQLVSSKGDHLKQEHGLEPNEVIDYAFELIRYSLEK